jgi:hypothetical protein
MVKKTRLLALLLCVALPSLALADVRLSIRADKKTLVLGEALSVVVKAEDVREPLSSISLDKLKQDFNVYAVSGNVQQQNRKGRIVKSEMLTLTMYPLRAGKLFVPALSYRGKSTQPLQVSVLESGKQVSRVLFKRRLDSAQPQVRQAATLVLEIYDDGSLQWSVPQEITATGAHQRRLAESQREEVLEGTRYTVHRYAWALMPLREGSLKIAFPMLDAFKFGARLRYAVAPLLLNAAPVPAYLPVHVPIGKPLLTMEALPAEIAVDRPVNWNFTVQSSGISVEGIGKLLASIRSNESLRFYPPEISQAGNERATTATQTLRVTLPFVPLRTGTLQLPDIDLPYYDPAGARVESVSVQGAQFEVINPLWQSVQKIALGFIALLALVAASYSLIKTLRRILKIRLSLRVIRNAASAVELRCALLNFESEKALASNLTLQQWLQRMQGIYGVDERLAALVQRLENMQYGADQTDAGIVGMAQETSRILHQPYLKYALPKYFKFKLPLKFLQ